MELTEAKKYAESVRLHLQMHSSATDYAPSQKDEALICLAAKAKELEAQRDELLEICRVAEKTAMEIHSGRRHEGSMPCGILADKLNRIIGEIDKKEKAVIGG